ncbi:Small ribosomal subunit protein eS8-like protein [Drosera capensis]
MHKRRSTGGKKKAWGNKRKYELGRQPANTKLSSNMTIRRVRVRRGNLKWMALSLDAGNYSWGTEAVTRKTHILDVVYNASNNEFVRTQTLVKSAIVQHPSSNGIFSTIVSKLGGRKSQQLRRKPRRKAKLPQMKQREQSCAEEVGEAQGKSSVHFEGKELEFYMKKLQRKKGKGAGAALIV